MGLQESRQGFGGLQRCPVAWLVPLALVLAIAVHLPAADQPRVGFARAAGELTIMVDGAPVATYVHSDQEISRPYLAHVRAPGDIPITRNHPPISGSDATDHATYHPGIWMAFGELGDSDYWRNKAHVVHDGFVEEPTDGEGYGFFSVRNRYLAQRGPQRLVCREVCRISWHVRPAGYLLLWDSTFSNDDRSFAFGDQEEMGLGVRVATSITEQHGGFVRDASGRATVEEVWGRSASWCDYSGRLQNRHVGVTLMCHPENFRPSWFHVRDYGLMLANPFGRQAFDHGEASRVVIDPGASLRLRYGVLLRAHGRKFKVAEIDQAYQDYRLLTNP